MSYQSSSAIETSEAVVIDKPKNEFERFLIQCLRAPEWQLRKFLKKVLSRAGFTIYEDNYRSERCDKEKRYESVHNMFAVRGEKPRVCLVAHTDICRDHTEVRRGENKFTSYGEYSYMTYDRHGEDTNKPRVPRPVEPVVKLVRDSDGVMRRIIQDKECRLQVGGDDRSGVAINTWIALNSGMDCMLYFPTDEEIGLKSASACEMPQLEWSELFVEVDRGNHSNELVTKIGGEVLCKYDTAVRLLEIADRIGKPRIPVNGMGTDVCSLKRRGKIKEAVNMTCGYMESKGDSGDEYLCLQETWDTLRYVHEIVKDYYLNP